MTPNGHCRLILTRHAKSDWDNPALEDSQRPLNERGRRSARALGDWLASRGYDPEEVICSPSRRTMETWDLVSGAVFETRPELRIEDKLYLAEPETMLSVLRTARAPTVMLIGHNPGIASFAERLPARPPMDYEFRKFPTAATLVVDFQASDWSQIQPGEGSVLDFVRLDGRE